MTIRFALLAPIALLAACGRDPDPTSVSIKAGDEGGATIEAQPGNESRLKIDTAGFKADIKVPGLGALTNKMEIDGVKLYPGSKVAGLNIAGSDEKAKGRFSMRFDAPDAPAKVGAWYGAQFAENGYTARRTPTGFAGNKKDGDWFTLDLSDAPGGHTAGEFKFGERQPQ